MSPLTALKNAYAEHREVGFSEAVYRAIPDMQLKKSNIGSIFVDCGFPEKRHSYFRGVKNGNEDFDDDFIQDEASDETNDRQYSKSSNGKTKNLIM